MRHFVGRSYLVGTPYLLPKDMGEVNRLDLQHYLLRHALRGNYAAPIDAPISILDVGTGTGRWAREMAAYFPNANVVGVDLIEPTLDVNGSQGGLDLRPANYSFLAANVLEGLPFADASFDFVHMRLLYLAIPANQWRGVIGELARVTRPGGWIESVEGDLARDGGPDLDTIFGWFAEVSQRRGIDLSLCRQVGTLLREAGLEQVTTRDITLPIGDYGDRLGTMAATNFLAGLDGIRALILSQGLATADQYDHAATAFRQHLPRLRCIQPFHIAYGQMPLVRRGS